MIFFPCNPASGQTLPTASDHTVVTSEDSTLSLQAPDFNFSDTDVGDVLVQVQITSLVSVGSLQFSGETVVVDQVIPAGQITNLTFTPVADAHGLSYDSFQFRVHDGTAYSASAYTMAVDVTAVNDAPELLAIGNQSVAEQSVLSFTATAGDADLPADTLTFSLDAASVSAGMTIDATTGAFSWTPGESQDGDHAVTLTVSDDGIGSLSDSESFTISVSEVNVAPVVGDIPGESIAEGSNFATFDLDDYVTDVDHSAAEINWSYAGNTDLAVSIDPNTHAVTISLPHSDWNGTETITFTALDTAAMPLADSDAAVFTVTAVNDAPVAVDDTVTSNEDTSLVITGTGLLANDNDVDGDSLSITSLGQPIMDSDGSVVDNGDGTYTYIPSADFNGNDYLIYAVSDGKGGLDTATVNLIITPQNDPPTISGTPDTSVDEDAPYSFEPDAGDIDGDQLTFSIINRPAWASFDPVTGILSGIPTDADVGIFSGIVIAVTDGSLSASLAAFDLVVVNVNDAPMAVDDDYTTDEDMPLTIAAPGLMNNDSDIDGDALTAVLADGPSSGALVFGSDGALTYTPHANFNGTDSFRYYNTDGGLDSNIATVTITVAAINDAPTDITISGSTVVENQPSGTVVGIFATEDVDVSDSHTFTLVAGPGDTDNVSFQIAGDTLKAKEVFDFETQSSYSIRVRANDQNGETYDEEFLISIIDHEDLTLAWDANDDPTLVGYRVYQSNISGGYDFDIENAIKVRIVEVEEGGGNDYAIVDFAFDAAESLIPAGIETLVISLAEPESLYWVVIAYDSWGQASDPTHEVSNANKTPIDISLSQQSLNENLPVGTLVGTFSTQDPDTGNSHIYTLAAGTGDDDNSLFTIEGSDLYTSESFNHELEDSYSILVQTDDQNRDNGEISTYQKAFTIAVNDVNDAPVISGTPPATTLEDAFYSFTPAGTDPDIPYGDSLTFSVVNLPGWASFDPATGVLSGTPSNADVGTTTGIEITVTDGEASDTLAAFDLEVINVNDIPVISGIPTAIAMEDATYSFTPTAVDSDLPYGDSLTFSVTNQPSWAEFDPALGVLSGTPTNADVGTNSGIVITVSDGSASASLEAFNVEVVNANDPPSISGIPANLVDEDIAYSFIPTVGDDDLVHGDVLTFSVADPPPWAAFDPATGRLSGTPANADVGSTSGIEITVTDGEASASLVPFDLTVVNVNDTPVITAQNPLSTVEETVLTITLADLVVVDPDNTYPAGFALTVGDGADYSRTGNVITPSPDFNGTLTVPVSVDDGEAANSTSAVFNLSVAVTGVNDEPLISGTPGTTVLEDELYSFTPVATDGDLAYGDVLTFSVANPPPWAAFDPATGRLSGTPSNVDVGSTSGIEITVTDGEASASLAPFDLTVVNVNDTPVITAQEALSTVEETQLTITLMDLIVTDPDNTYPAGFTLTVGDGADYSRTGNAITPSPDFNGTLTVPVSVDDGEAANSTSAAFNLSVIVTAVNDAPQITAQSPLSTAEETELTITLTDLIVIDPDNAYPAGFTLTVGDGVNYSRAGNAITPSPDFNGTLTVPVSVDDGEEGNSTSAVFDLSVTVTAVNDPPTAITLSRTGVDENQPSATVVGTFGATDPEVSDSHMYTLVAGAGDTDNASFQIAGDTLQTNEVFDYEIQSSYSIRVQADDQNGDTYEQEFKISIIDHEELTLAWDANDDPTLVGYRVYQTDVSGDYDFDIENAIKVRIVEVEEGGGNDYAIVDFASDAAESLIPAGIETLVISMAEPEPLYWVVVAFGSWGQASDPSYEISNANKVPSDINLSQQSLNENLPVGTLVGTFSTQDPDIGNSHIHTLAAGAGDEDNSKFAIEGNNLYANESFNHELGDSYSILIQTDDQNRDYGEISTYQKAFTIAVDNVNDAPVISGTPAATVLEDGVYSFSPDAADDDLIHGDDLTFSVINQPAWASFDPATGELSGTPFNADVGTTTGIEITVTDGEASATLAAFDLEVVNVNDGPSISGTPAATTLEDAFYNFTPAGTDPDIPYGDSLTFSVVNLPGWASFDPATGVLSGTPSNANVGTTTGIEISVTDGEASDTLAAFDLEVVNVNDAPVIIGQNPLSIMEESGLTINLTDLIVADPDNIYPEGFSLIVEDGTNYSRTGNAITPDPDFNGDLTVPVRVDDGEGINSASVVFDLSVTVTGINDAPRIAGQNPLSTAEETELMITLADLIVTDPDNTYPAGFTLTVGDGTNYSHMGNAITLSLDFNGMLTVPVRVDDGEGANSISTVFDLSVTVTGVNDAPVAADDTATVNEDTTLIITATSLLANDTDIDNDTLEISAMGQPVIDTDGSVVNNVDGTYTYIPGADFNGTDYLFYAVSDGQGGIDTATVTLIITPVNDAPAEITLSNNSIDENQPPGTLVGNFTSVDADDGDGHTYSLVPRGAGDLDWLFFTIAGNELRAAVTLDYEARSYYNLQVVAEDQSGEIFQKPFTIVVNNLNNEAPLGITMTSNTVLENQAAGTTVGTLLTTDQDIGQIHLYSLATGLGDDDNAFFTISADELQTAASFDFETRNTYNIRVKTDDQHGGAFEEKLTINVIDTNDAPVAVDDTAVTIKDTPVIIEVLGNDSDADGDGLSVTGMTPAVAASGTVELNGDGTFTYTPNVEFSGNEAFTYEISDGRGGSATASVNVTVYAAQFTLTWDPIESSEVAGYFLNIGTAPRVYTQTIDVGNVTSYTFDMAEKFVTYYMSVTAYDSDGQEIDFVKQEYSVRAESDNSLITSINYEDAWNPAVIGWTVSGDNSAGAVVGNVYDPDRGGRVIELAGSGLNSGYQLREENGEPWLESSRLVIEWSMQYSERFEVYIDVLTTTGQRYIYYTPVDDDGLGSGLYVHYGLGSDVIDGQWRTFVSDLQADLDGAQPGVSILEVNGFQILGSGRLDDITLKSNN